MPIYEYRCEACGAHEEKLESLSAPESHDCTSCRAELGMKRQLSVASFAFSGAGWYSSDYARKGSSEPKPEAAPSPKGGCCGGSCACAAK